MEQQKGIWTLACAGQYPDSSSGRQAQCSVRERGGRRPISQSGAQGCSPIEIAASSGEGSSPRTLKPGFPVHATSLTLLLVEAELGAFLQLPATSACPGPHSPCPSQPNHYARPVPRAHRAALPYDSGDGTGGASMSPAASSPCRMHSSRGPRFLIIPRPGRAGRAGAPRGPRLAGPRSGAAAGRACARAAGGRACMEGGGSRWRCCAPDYFLRAAGMRSGPPAGAARPRASQLPGVPRSAADRRGRGGGGGGAEWRNGGAAVTPAPRVPSGPPRERMPCKTQKAVFDVDI